MPFRTCTVSFMEGGQRHEVKVEAETVYEACCLALEAFRRSHFIKGPRKGATLQIETTKPAVFLVERRVDDVIDWLYYRASSSDEIKDRKKRLQALLADDRR